MDESNKDQHTESKIMRLIKVCQTSFSKMFSFMVNKRKGQVYYQRLSCPECQSIGDFPVYTKESHPDMVSNKPIFQCLIDGSYHDVESGLIKGKEMKYTPDYIQELKPNEVFVFGSNLNGFHGGGAARVAMEKFGAVWGQGVGLQGQSYAIPTMQGGVETIKPYVDDFIAFAKQHPELKFLVTRIGCGIAGFTDEEIAPLFAEAFEIDNICLPRTFCKIIENNEN